MSKSKEYLLLFLYVVIAIVVSYWLGQQAYGWMPIAATKEAQHVDRLFSFLITLGSLVFLGVTEMIGHSVIFNRADSDDYSEGHATRGNQQLEIIWIAVPTALVLWISLQSWSVYRELNLEGLGHPIVNIPAPNTSTQNSYQTASLSTVEEIQVTAKQWEWSFYYPQADLISGELHLPMNKETRLVFESKDVIHGFFIPQFRFKQDIIPNRSVNITFTPLLQDKYILHDSQFSGTYFALMEADVYVEPQAAYDNWLKTANSNSSIKPNLAAAEYERSHLERRVCANVSEGDFAPEGSCVAHRRKDLSASDPQDRGASLKTAFKSNWDTVKPAISTPVVANSAGD